MCGSSLRSVAALATDMLIRSGGQIAPLSTESLQAFNAMLPPHWSHGNPIDVLGDAAPLLVTTPGVGYRLAAHPEAR